MAENPQGGRPERAVEPEFTVSGRLQGREVCPIAISGSATPRVGTLADSRLGDGRGRIDEPRFSRGGQFVVLGLWRRRACGRHSRDDAVVA